MIAQMILDRAALGAIQKITKAIDLSKMDAADVAATLDAIANHLRQTGRG